jgi:AcrR family transcriptional regulator
MEPAGRIRMRRPGTPGPRGGGLYVSELQRARLLSATFAVVAEQGYQRMTVRKVSGRAGISNKTFYDLFSDREDCFLAALEDAIDRIATVVVAAWKGEREWSARIRAALGSLLALLDCEPKLCALVFVEALSAGPRVLARRAEVLERVAGTIDEGRRGMRASRELPPLTAEGIVGAAFGVIYARVQQNRAGTLKALLNPLMATIVLPYRGQAASAKELQCVDPEPATDSLSGTFTPPGEHPTSIDFRLTVRTQKVLVAVDELAGRGSDPSNRQIADAAGVADPGQISKLLARLEGLGLLHNTSGESQGVPNAWRMTPRGEEIARVGHAQDHHPDLPGAKR